MNIAREGGDEWSNEVVKRTAIDLAPGMRLPVEKPRH